LSASEKERGQQRKKGNKSSHTQMIEGLKLVERCHIPNRGCTVNWGFFAII